MNNKYLSKLFFVFHLVTTIHYIIGSYYIYIYIYIVYAYIYIYATRMSLTAIRHHSGTGLTDEKKKPIRIETDSLKISII